jgi:hypothetical protein
MPDHQMRADDVVAPNAVVQLGVGAHLSLALGAERNEVLDDFRRSQKRQERGRRTGRRRRAGSTGGVCRGARRCSLGRERAERGGDQKDGQSCK